MLRLVHYGKAVMAFLWEDKYLTGVEEIDKEHKKLFLLIYDLENLTNEGAFNSRKVKRMIVLLGSYVRIHLSYEKEWMAKHRYQFSEEAEHINKDFLSLYQVLRNEIEDKEVNQNLLRMLCVPAQNWLINHMSLTNKTIRKILEQGATNPPPSILEDQIQKQNENFS